MNPSPANSRNTDAEAAVRTRNENGLDALPYLETTIPVGLAGAVAVAVIIFVFDLFAGQPLATPNALGASIFRGMPLDLASPIEAINIFSYTLLHAALFIIAATAAIKAEVMLSAYHVSLNSQFVMGIVCLFIVLQASILTMLMILDVPVVNDFGMSRLVVINALAATAMATAFYRRALKRLAKA